MKRHRRADVASHLPHLATIELDEERTPGCWDSLHVFEVAEKGGRSATYELTSTIMLSLGRKDTATSFELAGSLTRQVSLRPILEEERHSERVGERAEQVFLYYALKRQNKTDQLVKDGSSHISNMGRMIEDMEAKMRNQLQEVYFGKTRDIIGTLRSTESLAQQRQAKDLQRELMGLWRK